MRAVLLREFGPAANLRVEDVPDPRPGTGQVRVRVEVAGMHLLETWTRQGRQIGPHPVPRLPAIPGGEVAGTIDTVGPGVDTTWLGRRVLATTGETGGYAELAVADLTGVHTLPDGLDTATAVAMSSTGVTAMAVWELAEVHPGETVLVTGAAGGVGLLLLQLAAATAAPAIGVRRS